MKQIIPIYKPHSQTPLQTIQKFKQAHLQYKDTKMTYAGRLDPMAEGLLLLLAGDRCKDKSKYLDLDKTYIVDILWGFATDSYDILGLITDTSTNTPSLKNIAIQLKHHSTTFDQPYPPYSSKTVQGKPLWIWQKENQLDTITIPTKTVTIHSIKHLKDDIITNKRLLEDITQKINYLEGDFRQSLIINNWKEYLSNQPKHHHTVTQIKVTCSSGTYMRSLANTIGKQLNTAAIALNINRTQIGKYRLKE